MVVMFTVRAESANIVTFDHFLDKGAAQKAADMLTAHGIKAEVLEREF